MASVNRCSRATVVVSYLNIGAPKLPKLPDRVDASTTPETHGTPDSKIPRGRMYTHVETLIHMSEDPPRLLSTGRAARALGVGHQTLADWVRTGKVKPTFTTAGGHYRFDLDDLRRQIAEITESPADS
ncbi:helix-turn-helix domain-containing protein [Pseudonocardia sp. NPDC046786]|uniref:helix-turn-helix domain-containing protein n=1 Tax=Pseudonocardia sp. NPDC046786 TaxID=3155471 RepID=UPI0033C995B8